MDTLETEGACSKIKQKQKPCVVPILEEGIASREEVQ